MDRISSAFAHLLNNVTAFTPYMRKINDIHLGGGTEFAFTPYMGKLIIYIWGGALNLLVPHRKNIIVEKN